MDPRQLARTAVANHVCEEAGIESGDAATIKVFITDFDFFGDGGWTAQAVSNAHTDKVYLVAHKADTRITTVTEYSQSAQTQRIIPASDEDDDSINQRPDYHGSTVNINGSRHVQIGHGNVQSNHFSN